MFPLLRRSFLLSSASCFAACLPGSAEAKPVNALDAAIHGLSDQELNAFIRDIGKQISGWGMWGVRATSLAYAAIPAARHRRVLNGDVFGFRPLNLSLTLHNTILSAIDERLTDRERLSCLNWLSQLPGWRQDTNIASLQPQTTREQHGFPEGLFVEILELLQFGGDELPYQIRTNTVGWEELRASKRNGSPAKQRHLLHLL